MGVIIAVIVVVVILAIAFGLWQYTQQRRTEQARTKFGPEYERTAQQYGGDERKAASVLRDREQEIEKVEIKPLSMEQRERYAEQWRSIQAQFVDDPGGAVSAADNLIADAMRTLGYPVDQFDQREAAVSVKYPEVADNYRQAHAIAEQQRSGQAGTEDLRGAMVLYRSLFARLVGMPETSATEVSS